MHFWIDKRSQGCGFNGRHLVPPYLSGYGRNQRFLCGSYHPKPMVTPVHRFQSIESVANNGLRHHNRSSGYRSRAPAVHHTVNCVPASSHVHRNISHIEQSVGTISPAGKLLFKCGILVVLAFLIFFLISVNYFPGETVMKLATAFFLLIMAILSCLFKMNKTSVTVPPSTPQENNGTMCTVLDGIEQQDRQQEGSHHNHHHHHHNQVPTSRIPTGSVELPPPPYHIAVMLPSQNDTETIEVIRDSPPPSYEKAVT